MATKQKQLKKNNIWSEVDEFFLLELWEEKFQELRGNRKYSHIYKEMANSFQPRNSLFSPDEIRVKIHNLTSRYRKEKQIVGPSGGSPSEWKLYHRVHAILGQLRINNLESIFEDSIVIDYTSSGLSMSRTPPSSPRISPSSSASDISESVEIPETPVASTSRAARKQKRKPVNPYAADFRASENRIKNQIEEIRNTDQELIQIERERNAILERFVSSSDQFQTDLIALLNKK